MTAITIGGVAATPAKQRVGRLSLLIWGAAGVGKTTLAATLPGRILHICYDPEGAQSLMGFDNVDTVDLSDSSSALVEQFKSERNPLGLKDAIGKYDSIIFDSLTNIEDKTLTHGITQTKGATVERPSPGAYGVRSSLIIRLIKNVLSVTRQAGIHVAFIAHEADAVTDDAGLVTEISLSLGGKLPGKVGIDISEVWSVYDTGKERRVAVRPVRKRKPMKSRMFVLSGDAEFTWTYDAEKPNDDPSNDGMRISDWWDTFQKNEGVKIPLPGTKEYAKIAEGK